MTARTPIEVQRDLVALTTADCKYDEAALDAIIARYLAGVGEAQAGPLKALLRAFARELASACYGEANENGSTFENWMQLLLDRAATR